MLGDSAYGTGELLAAAADGGHTAIIKPWPLRPAVDGGFTLDDFTVDEAAGTVTCPNGLTRPITRTRKAIFGARCRDCPLRARCTTSARGRTLPCTRTTRCSARTGPAPRIPSSRPSTASTGPWSNGRSPGWSPAATGGCGSSGHRRNDLWLHHRVAALNLRRLLTLGLTRSGGTWALAPA